MIIQIELVKSNNEHSSLCFCMLDFAVHYVYWYWQNNESLHSQMQLMKCVYVYIRSRNDRYLLKIPTFIFGLSSRKTYYAFWQIIAVLISIVAEPLMGEVRIRCIISL